MAAANETNIDGNQFVNFILQAYKVKTLPRTGWLKNGISGTNVEHVGDHMWGASLLPMLLLSGIRDVDVQKVSTLCMIHDMAESIVGDITPHCGVSKEEKAQRELEAMEKLIADLPSEVGSNLMSLFNEFEAKETTESILAHDIDKLDMVLQAHCYENENSKCDLSEFYQSVSPLANAENLIEARKRLASVAKSLLAKKMTSL